MISVQMPDGTKEQAFMFFSSKMKTIMGLYPRKQAEFQEELNSKIQQIQGESGPGPVSSAQAVAVRNQQVLYIVYCTDRVYSILYIACLLFKLWYILYTIHYIFKVY